MQWLTTTLVLERLRSADDDAWNMFVARFRQPVVRFAADLGLPPHEAEDAAQETLAEFLRTYREGRYDREKGRLHSWLFGIARRVALNRGRKLARQQQRSPAGQRTGFWDDIPDDAQLQQTWDRSWQTSILEQCLRRVRADLEPRTVEAFELVALQERPAADVADELGMSRNAVFLAKHRVLKRIRELQEEIENIV